MPASKHIRLFAYSFITWLTFFLIGLPDYYQRWPFWVKVCVVVLVTFLYFPVTRFTLRRFWNDQKHFSNSLWLSFYLTLPLFLYDYILIGLYWEFGIRFIIPFWYLSFFYFSFWFQFPLVGWLMQKEMQVAGQGGGAKGD